MFSFSTEAMRAAAQEFGLKHESKERRVLLHNADNHLGRRLQLIWSRVPDLVRSQAREHWSELTAGALPQSGKGDLKALVERLTDLEQRRFHGDFDTGWVDAATEAATEMNLRGITPALISHAFGAFASRLGKALRESWADEDDTLWQCIDALYGKAIAEVEVSLGAIALSEKQNAALAVQSSALRFNEATESKVGEALALSESVREKASGASQTARNMLSNISGVATAAEQSTTIMSSMAGTSSSLLGAMIEAQNEVSEVAQIASKAALEASGAHGTAKGMLTHAEAIESILTFIRDVNKRTNLLSINATIEAARAGEYGRSFSIVAQEVKALAAQTAGATEDIANKVGAIQLAARQTVAASGSIEETAASVHQRADEVNRMIDRQTNVVQSIAHAVQETAAAALTISSEVAAMRNSIADVASEITNLETDIQSVDTEIHELQQSAERFASGMASGQL